MSIENAERLIRFMEKDSALREKVSNAGADRFVKVTNEAGASCSAYDLVCAVAKHMNQAA